MIRTFSFLVFAISSVCLGATLMQNHLQQSNLLQSVSIEIHDDQDICSDLFHKNQNLITRTIAKEMYSIAFKENLDGNTEMAARFSKCALVLSENSYKWNIDSHMLKPL